MKVTILSSGSSGNATLIEHENVKMLLDCGCSYKNLKQRLEEVNCDIKTISYVFISHEHIDHVRAIEQISKHLDVVIVMSQGTLSALTSKYEINNDKLKIVKHFSSFEIKNIKIGSLLLSHDANEPLLFVFKNNHSKFWFFHDSGYMPEKYFNILKNPTLMIIESNYDVKMLLNSNKYPHYLKMRIHGDDGHLSNEQTYNYVSNLVGNNTKEIIIAHVSENNNKEEIIHNLYKEFILQKNVKLSISKQKQIMKTRSL